MLRIAVAVMALGGFVGLGPPLVSTSIEAGSDRLLDDFEARSGRLRAEVLDLATRLRAPNLADSRAERLLGDLDDSRRRAEDLWRATHSRLAAAFEGARAEILRYNAEAERLDFEAIVIGSRVDLFNNLGTYTTRPQFDENRARIAREWESDFGAALGRLGPRYDALREAAAGPALRDFGVDLAASGFGKPDSANPYVAPSSIYARYYLPDGRLSVDLWRRDAVPWDRYRTAVVERRRVLEAKRAELEARSRDLEGLRARFVAVRTEILGLIRDAEAARR